jgi:Polyketide cyclase / dehydrase and lipid transport
VRVEGSHRYDVPVEHGFAFITDTANWSRFWPGYVRLEPGSSWGRRGDTAVLVTRILGRERELRMTITEFEPNRSVAYASTQPGLPDARHERHFEPDRGGFLYRLVVEYEPRGGLSGVLDRVLLPRGIKRAFAETFTALDRELASDAG